MVVGNDEASADSGGHLLLTGQRFLTSIVLLWTLACKQTVLPCNKAVNLLDLCAATEHDPEKWEPVFRKIMLKQSHEIVMRLSAIASRWANAGARSAFGICTFRSACGPKVLLGEVSPRCYLEREPHGSIRPSPAHGDELCINELD